jgi:hypothetical protein
MFIGSNSGHTTTGSNLPKAISALTTVPTSWTWSDNGTIGDTTNNIYNATYDVWFSTAQAETGTTVPSGGFLMVWYYKPPNAQPIGQIRYSAVTIPGVPGTWNVWIGLNGTRPVTSYVATTPVMTLSYDLNLFIQDAVHNRTFNGAPALQPTWWLSNIFIGFEIWKGGVNLETTNFCAIVN